MKNYSILMCVFVRNRFRLMRVIQLTPLLVGLPVRYQPKGGAIESTFNEQSLTLSHPPPVALQAA